MMPEEIVTIPLSSLKPSPNNSRKQKVYDNLDELVLSIKRHGLQEPPVINQRNEVVAGQRRVRACELLGMAQITCRRKIFDSPVSEILYSATENLQRNSLTIEDRIALVKTLLPQFKTLTAVAEALGLNRSTVSNWLVGTSLGTPEEIEALAEGESNPHRSRYIVEAVKAANLQTPEERKKAIEALKGLSTSQLEALSKQVRETGSLKLDLEKPAASLPQFKEVTIHIPLKDYRRLEQAARKGNKSIELTILDAIKAYLGAVLV